MSLKLIKPGRRGKYWYVRGTILGQRVEASTRTADKGAAEVARLEIEQKIRSATTTRVTTYGEAAEKYILEHPGISKWEALIHRKLQSELFHRPLSSINQSVLFEMASLFYPDAKPSTKNRWVVRTIAAVMHYASNLGLSPWIRFKKFPEERPKPRAVTKDVAGIIINEAGKQKNNADLKQLICLWMFKHGNRISEILSVQGQNIDTKEKTFRIYISKTRTWETFALDQEVHKALRESFPMGIPEGRLFPWTHRWSVYKWLRPMCKGLGIPFTPHAARHSLGTWYASAGEGLRATMSRLGHKDVKSSMRYQNEDMEVTRQANQRIGNIGGKIRGVKKISNKTK